MEILNLEDNLDFEKVIFKTIHALRAHDLVILPSDSCYGLSGLAFELDVVKKIAQFKSQSLDKPISVCLASASQLWDFVEFDQNIQDFIELYWPGPITLVLPLKETAQWVGFRLPDHNLMRSLVAELKAPIYTTSANQHGKPEVYDLEQLSQQELDSEDLALILNAGTLDLKLPSAVLKFDDLQFVVLREHPCIQNIDKVFSLKHKQ